MALTLNMRMNREEFKTFYHGIRDTRSAVYRYAGESLKGLSMTKAGKEGISKDGVSKEWLYYKFLRKLSHHTCKFHKVPKLNTDHQKHLTINLGNLTAKIDIIDEKVSRST